MTTTFASVPTIDQVTVEERAASFAKRSIKTSAKLAGLKMAVSMIDLTTLEGKDTPGRVAYLCRKALQPAEPKYDVPPCAAVCVYPNLVRHARRFLGERSAVKIASVATGFPSGQYPLRTKLEETRRAAGDGADEIDMVIARGAFLAGDYRKMFDEIAAVKAACGDSHLKVILETGELVTYDNVRLASQIAMEAGGDFIKTSTGKVQPAATMPVTLVMLEAIRDYFFATGLRIGMKPAGGIRTAKQALAYLVMVKETLGDDWLTPDLFRIGASTLLNDVLMQIAKTVDGNYQGADYFSIFMKTAITVKKKNGLAAKPALLARPVTPAKKRRLEFGHRWDYAPAPETAPVKIDPRHELFIDGKFTAPRSGQYFDSINPATEAKLCEIARGDGQDVDRAVAAARRAFENVWSRTSGRERGKYLYRVARVLQEKARELAVLESMDGGKPIKESRDFDVPMAAAHFFYHAGWADKLEYAFPGRKPRPLGVAGQIIPWNFPLLMAAWKIAPALACGNTVVLKPSKSTSITALRLARIFQEAGLPDGVLNVVTGDAATGTALYTHPDVNKIAFTGSTEVGKVIARACAGTGKKLTLELGGKAANIIMEDAPIDQAIEGVVSGIYFNQGHVCCAGSRLLVQEGIYDAVIHKLRNRIQTLRVGDPLDKNTDVGAINSGAQLEKIRELVRCGQEEGAEVEQSSCALPSKGYWFPPTFLTSVTMSHRVAREEIFGPVLSVMTFRTPEEALERANNTPYGLSAGVWTDKGSKIFKMAGKLRAGVVWANCYNKFDPASPFGGYKESGFGREGGAHGLAAYVQLT